MLHFFARLLRSIADLISPAPIRAVYAPSPQPVLPESKGPSPVWLCTRVMSSNTGENAENLLQLIRSPALVRLVLFASPGTPGAEYSNASDGPETNLPLVAALAELAIPVAGIVTLVFDGLFLTAQRHPRYGEIRLVLDEAQQRDGVFFASEPAPFTSSLPPIEAANRLRLVGPIQALTPASRPEYFSMLSALREEEFAR